MSLHKKHIGYIFHHEEMQYYYLAPGQGSTCHRHEAYVYTVKEAKEAFDCKGFDWGGKQHGKWIAVYE
jgi:hypothetical protein